MGFGVKHATLVGLIHLVLDAGLVEAVPADGTRVGADVPRPHCHGIPLLDLESRSHLQ